MGNFIDNKDVNKVYDYCSEITRGLSNGGSCVFSEEGKENRVLQSNIKQFVLRRSVGWSLRDALDKPSYYKLVKNRYDANELSISICNSNYISKDKVSGLSLISLCNFYKISFRKFLSRLNKGIQSLVALGV